MFGSVLSGFLLLASSSLSLFHFGCWAVHLQWVYRWVLEAIFWGFWLARILVFQLSFSGFFVIFFGFIAEDFFRVFSGFLLAYGTVFWVFDSGNFLVEVSSVSDFNEFSWRGFGSTQWVSAVLVLVCSYLEERWW